MIHDTIVSAIEAATRDTGQPQDVARQLISWLEAVVSGSENLEDAEAISRRCDFLYGSVQLENGQDE